MHSPKPTNNSDFDESDSQTISLILNLFQRSYVIDELSKDLVGEFTYEQNQLVCIPKSEQTTPINNMSDND